jgi:hypothetical protein
MERKNTPRPRLLIFLSTLHNSAVHNLAFNGSASLPDKDMEPAVNRQGWVNVPCTTTVQWTGPWCCQRKEKCSAVLIPWLRRQREATGSSTGSPPLKHFATFQMCSLLFHVAHQSATISEGGARSIRYKKLVSAASTETITSSAKNSPCLLYFSSTTSLTETTLTRSTPSAQVPSSASLYWQVLAQVSYNFHVRNISQHNISCTIFVCFWCQHPPAGHGLLIHDVSRSHSTHHSR